MKACLSLLEKGSDETSSSLSRFVLRPTPDQERLFRPFAGACRFVYNRGLALKIERHPSGEKRLGYSGTANLLPLWKRDPEIVWLGEIHSQILQALKDPDRAYRNFFANRAGIPTVHKHGAHFENQAAISVHSLHPGYRSFW